MELMIIVKMTSRSLYHWAGSVASFCVFVALALSLYLIFNHLTNYTNPQEQKWLIGVVFMVPVYSVESLVSFWKPSLSIECDILRNCYEAFALYSFGNYLIACLGGEGRIGDLLEKKSSVISSVAGSNDKSEGALEHPFPLKLLLEPWIYGLDCFRTIRFGIVQYMILKTVCALLSMLLEVLGLYGDGDFHWNSGYPYITIVLNFSQMWALYCLVQFYNITHDELKAIRPLAKFLCFKAIVFATWWQGVIIAILCACNILPRVVPGIPKVQATLQDFIICFEMAIAAIAHTYIFPTDPYQASLYHVSHVKYSVSSEASAKQPLLSIDELEEECNNSYSHGADTDFKLPCTSLKESMQDLVIGGGERVVEDVKITVTQVVEPMEKGITALNEKFHRFHWMGNENEPRASEIRVEGKEAHDKVDIQEAGVSEVRVEGKEAHDKIDVPEAGMSKIQFEGKEAHDKIEVHEAGASEVRFEGKEAHDKFGVFEAGVSEFQVKGKEAHDKLDVHETGLSEIQIASKEDCDNKANHQ